jgi:hypothetical protein
MTSIELKLLKECPKDLPPLLQAMWHDYNGNWEVSHNIAQEINSRDGSWIHAYLHRKEGDPSNAQYWYRKAGRPVPIATIEEEWEEIVAVLLKI